VTQRPEESRSGDLTQQDYSFHSRIRLLFVYSLNGRRTNVYEQDAVRGTDLLQLQSKDAAKLREMYDRFGMGKKLEERQALEYAIECGRGSIWIELTEQQYRKLKTNGGRS
jgi:hypothetical protein